MADRPVDISGSLTGCGRLSARPLVLGIAVLLAVPCFAAPSGTLTTGSLTGLVTDTAGVPQMGATVFLYNRYDKLVQKTITSLKGDFLFEPLIPDTYSVRVSLASFVPALKRNITVLPGMQSVLAINMASVLSSIELVYSAPKAGVLMSDEWKWVLRSQMSTRPILRSLPGLEQHETSVFSDTNGLLRVSAGESSPWLAGGQPDLGTAFALATSLFGNNRFEFTGNFGYGMETATQTHGFRTTFSRAEAAGPEVKLTMQQADLPVRSGIAVGGQQNANLPALRTLSLTMIDRAQLADGIDIEYGASLESVTFFDRLNYVSPFARVSYDLGGRGRLAFGYSSGAPPIDLIQMDARDRRESLQQELAALSLLPRVTLRGGRAHVQRTENLEAGYQFATGSRTYSFGVYREIVRDGALTITGADDLIGGFDLLPELSSRSSVFNIGGYARTGYTAAVTQDFSDDYSLTLAYGSGGVLRTEERALESDNPSAIRRLLHRGQQSWITGRFNGVVPGAGTRFHASYQWTDYRALTPAHVYFTQSTNSYAGLNLRLRQPLPAFSGMPGRLEATAELRNMLAQGYLPITTASGRRMLLTHTPRAVRGGLSFIF
ncbi:MAG TPA: carboxypeptidase-like regulatory domain-containing protein [Bryobacteraceae bacterium]|nr:carboxypeptidase-like regulatory domain-containing protein [Bryobacteraceae bacterium]